MSKAFDIVPLKEDFFDAAIEFLRENFFPEEPCAKAIQLCPLGYRIPALENQIRQILVKNFSLVAKVPDTDQIAGVVVVDHKVSGDWEGLEVGPCQCQSFPDKFRKLDRFFSDLCTAYGKRDTLKSLGVNGALDIFIVCTGRNHQGQGLATALFEECCKVAEDKGLGAVECMALSFYTQKICHKLGFQEHFRIPYADYEQDGDLLFGEADMGLHQSGIFFAKKF